MLEFILEFYKSYCPPKPTFLPEHYPDLEGKTVAITGTSSGIGYTSTKLLLEKNAKVVVFNRESEKLKKSLIRLQEDLPQINLESKLVSVIVDLADLTSFKNVDADLKKHSVSKFEYVILNAGVMTPPNNTVTKQGYELQTGTNCLGHFMLMQKLDKYILAAASPSFNPRVVWLSSVGHRFSKPQGGIDLDDKFTKNVAKNGTPDYYGRSKTGNIYQAAYYAQLHKNDGIISVSAHPGLIRSDLGSSLPSIVDRIYQLTSWPTEYGSYTELFAALSPDVTLEQSGEYIGPFGNFSHKLRSDISLGRTNGTAKKFWEWCEKQIEPYV